MCPVCVSAASMCVHMSGVCTDISSSERCTVRDTMIVTTVSCPVPSLPMGAGPHTVTMDLGAPGIWDFESGIKVQDTQNE